MCLVKVFYETSKDFNKPLEVECCDDDEAYDCQGCHSRRHDCPHGRVVVTRVVTVIRMVVVVSNDRAVEGG